MSVCVISIGLFVCSLEKNEKQESDAHSLYIDEEYVASAENISTDNHIEDDFCSVDEVAYSVTQYDEEWADMSYAEQLEACQLDEEYLESLTTEELLQVALDYPFKLDFGAYDDIQLGVEHIRDKSNVIDELLSREDVSSVVLDAYIESTVDYNIALAEDYDSVISKYEVSGYWDEKFLSAILTYDEVAQSLTEEEIESMAQEVIKKTDHADLYDTSLNTATILLDNEQIASKVVGNLNESESRSYTERFVLDGDIVQSQTSGVIYYSGKYYKYGYASLCYRYASNDFSDEVKEENKEYVTTLHPSWVYVSEATGKYNCHSYCWINYSSNNIYWLPNAEAYAASTYFTQAGTNISVPQSNSYIILNSTAGPVHSLRSRNASVTQGSNIEVWTKSCICESKLGNWGVYRCNLYDACEMYDAVSYRVFIEKE